MVISKNLQETFRGLLIIFLSEVQIQYGLASEVRYF